MTTDDSSHNGNLPDAQKRQLYQGLFRIPVEALPPDLYQLLDLELLESDPQVIEIAAQRRMDALKSAMSDWPAKSIFELMEEVNRAKRVLMSANAKAKYDEKILAQLAAAQSKSAVLKKDSKPEDLAETASLSPARTLPAEQSMPRRAPKKSPWTLVISIAMGPITVFGGFWLIGGFDKFAQNPKPNPDKGKQVAANEPTSFESVQPKPKSIDNTLSNKSSTPRAESDGLDRLIANPDIVETRIEPNGAPPSSFIPLQAVSLINTLDEFAEVPPIEIPANRALGGRVGPLTEGAFLLVQYVDGIWSNRSGYAEESPDAERIAKAENRLVISSIAFNGETTRQTTVLGNTQVEPFVDQVDEGVRDWHLGIEGGSSAQFDDNTGVVRYRIAQLAVPGAPATDSSKLAIPSGFERRDAATQLRNTFRAAYAAVKKPRDAQSLADRFLKQSRAVEDPVERYALLDQARALALGSGGLDLGLSVIREMSGVFQLNELSERINALDETASRIRTSKEAEVLEPYYQKTIDALSDIHRYDEAVALASELSSLGLRIRDAELRKRASLLRKDVQAKKEQWDKEVTLKKLLGNRAEVSKVHLLLGKYLAFNRGQWDEGLPHLVKGGDEKLKSIAALDLAQPGEAKLQRDLGNAWQEFAETLPESPIKTAVLRRAGDWYLRVAPQLEGTERLQVTEQLKKLGEVTNLLTFINSAVGKQGNWMFENGVLTSPIGAWSQIQADYVPPEEYQVTLVAEWVGHADKFAPGRDAVLIGLSHAEGQFAVALDWDVAGGGKPCLTGFIELDGRFSWTLPMPCCHISPPILVREQSNTIDVFVRKTGVTVQVNGQQLVNYDGSYDRLQLGTQFQKMPGLMPNKLFVGTHHASYRFSRFEVRRAVPESP